MVYKKGHILSEESRRKISEANKGKHLSEETRKKISEAHKGKISSMKGKHWSEEIKKRMSESAKKRMSNPEERKKLSEAHKRKITWNKGISPSEETRKKISEANKGRPAWNKGKPFSEETRRKISESRKGKSPWNKELKGEKYKKHYSNGMGGTFKLRQIPHNKGISPSEETKRKISEANTGRHHSKESRRRISEGHIGEKNSAWKGGKSFEPYPLYWTNALKKSIRERDNNTCQLCFKEGKAVHHMDYNKKNCNPENLITLCQGCHLKTNENREKWIKFFWELKRLKAENRSKIYLVPLVSKIRVFPVVFLDSPF